MSKEPSMKFAPLRAVASRSVVFAALLAVLVVVPARAQVGVFTQHNDTYRTGANLNETILNTKNVNSQTFGKLFARAVDGEVYAQPLYVSGLTVPGYGTCNVVYVATMHNSVYAFDADDPNAKLPLWKVNLGPSIPVGDVQYISDISTEVGILSTPVIDPATGIMYLVARTKEAGNFVQRLHALDLKTGNERLGGPVVIQATYPGTGDDSDGINVHFNPQRQNQRPGLLLSKGMVVIAWASHNDIRPYHGWLMTFDATTLQKKGVYCTTPDGGLGGVWQSGQGIAVDDGGFLHFMTGNGDFNANEGGRNLGDSFVKLKLGVDGSLSMVDWFSPHNNDVLNAWDADLGSAGVLVMPGTKYVLGAGKESVLYLLDRNNLGHFRADEDTQIPQRFQAGAGHVHGSPILWSHPTAGRLVYLWSEQGFLTAFRFLGDRFDTQPFSRGSTQVPDGMPGAMLSISANGSKTETAIVWASHPREGNANNAVTPGILRAYNAADLTQEIWTSEDDADRDRVPTFGKFAPPTVANGKVYLPTFSGEVLVYGLLASARADALNAGGGAVNEFKADSGFAGGSPVAAPATLAIDVTGIAGPAPLNVYRTARQGNFSYTRTGLTPYARYTVRLHFADVTNGRMPRGGVMNVIVNGVRALSDFSIPRATSGTARAVVRTFVFNASVDGKATILFRAGRLGPISSVGSRGLGRPLASATAFLPSQGGCLVNGIEIVPGAGS
jgi:hypothetical protein